MTAPSKTQLSWAVTSLSSWGRGLGQANFLANLPRLLAFRYLGASVATTIAFDGGTVKEAATLLFGIADSPDELAITGQRYFFNPFNGRYMKETWPTGTWTTRLATGSQKQWMAIGKSGEKQTCRIKETCIASVRTSLGVTLIPAVALGVFFLRRPSVLAVDAGQLTGAASYAAAVQSLLNMEEQDFLELFSTADHGLPAAG